MPVHAQEGAQLRDGGAQWPTGMPVQDNLQSPTLRRLSDDPEPYRCAPWHCPSTKSDQSGSGLSRCAPCWLALSQQGAAAIHVCAEALSLYHMRRRNGVLRPVATRGSQEPRAREASGVPALVPNGATSSPMFRSSGGISPSAGYNGYGPPEEATLHLSQRSEMRSAAYIDGVAHSGQRSAAQQQYGSDGREGYGLDRGLSRSAAPDQAAAAPRAVLVPGTGASSTGNELFSHSAAGGGLAFASPCLLGLPTLPL